ncbi:MAG: endonuclease domain-containing protein [Anaerolineales bacterium]
MPRNVCSGQKIHESKYLESKLLRRRMTPAERFLWSRLRGNRLGGHHFRRQQIIAGFIVDFYCHQAGLIVIVDGPVHRRNPGLDVERDTILHGMGFRIVRFTNEEVIEDVDSVIRRIGEAGSGDGRGT